MLKTKPAKMSAPPSYNDSVLYNRKTGDDFQLADTNERHGFILRVYTILMVMLGFTVATSALFISNESVGNFVKENFVAFYVLSIVFMFVTLFMMLCIPSCRYESPHNFLCLSVFTLCVSIMVGTVTMQYDTIVVLLAFGATTAITLSLTLFAFQTKIDFTGLGPYLLAILIGLIFLGIIQIWVKNQVLNTVTAAIGAILFSFYIIYDTQLMIGGEHKNSIGPDEYIFAALSLYLDIINLFLYLLQLIGGSD